MQLLYFTIHIFRIALSHTQLPYVLKTSPKKIPFLIYTQLVIHCYGLPACHTHPTITTTQCCFPLNLPIPIYLVPPGFNLYFTSYPGTLYYFINLCKSSPLNFLAHACLNDLQRKLVYCKTIIPTLTQTETPRYNTQTYKPISTHPNTNISTNVNETPKKTIIGLLVEQPKYILQQTPHYTLQIHCITHHVTFLNTIPSLIARKPLYNCSMCQKQCPIASH